MLFISHRTTDKDAAEELKRRALEQGYSADQLFLDSDGGIAPGDDWQQKLYASLAKSRAMFVLCSPNWLTSHWCFVELGYAKATAMAIFPLLIETCDLDSTLNLTQATDISTARDKQVRNSAFKQLWKALKDKHLGPKDISPWPPVGEEDKCPFPGLSAFPEKFAPVYFGREVERDQFIADLDGMRQQGVPRLLMITGGSGGGKSSLLRASVRPWLNHTLEKNNWLPLPILRFNETSEQHTLLGRLAEELAARFPIKSRPDWTKLRAAFESQDAHQAARAFSDQVGNLNMADNCIDRTIVVLIDQFEELLSTPDRPSAGKFLAFLQALLSGSDRRLLVVGTMRSDYLNVYEQHIHAVQSPFFKSYPLPPFPWSRVTDLIKKPAARVGVTFTDELVNELEKGCPENDPLSLLAVTLESLYRKHNAEGTITIDHYNALGGMDGAIKEAVSRALLKPLSPTEEKALRLCFVRYLAKVNDEDRVVRRPGLWSKLRTDCPLLENFVREHLLHTTGKGEAAMVEVSHESLFRCWDKLVDWLQESARVLRWRRDVERDWGSSPKTSRFRLTQAQLAVSRRWPTEIPDELSTEETAWIKQGIRRERVFRSSVAAIILIITSLGIGALYQRSVAIQQTEVADSEARMARVAKIEAKASNYETKQANDRNLEQLHKASMADHASARKAWQEDYDAERQGRWAASIGHTSKWHEAVALWARALELEPTNDHASYGLYDMLLHRGHARANLPQYTVRHEGVVHRASFSSDGARVVTASEDKTARVWDAATGQPVCNPLRHEGRVTSASFSPDGARIVTTSEDKTARVWDAATGAPHGEPFRHEGFVYDASFSPDSARILTRSVAYNARVWDVASGAPLGNPLQHNDIVWSASFSPDGAWVVTASQDKTARVWDIATGAPHGDPFRHEDGVDSASFSPDGARVVTASRDNTARVWNAATGTPLGAPLRHENSVNSASFSPDGARVVTTSLDGTARVWDAATGAPVAAPLRHEVWVVSASFSPDGAQVVTASMDRTARIWDVATGAPLSEPLRHEDRVVSASFSPDGTRVVTASWDKTARVWDVATGAPLDQSLRHDDIARHNDIVENAHFSPDSARVVTTRRDKTARVWNAGIGAPVAVPLQHERRVVNASFSPNGAQVVTASEDKTARVWDAATGAPLGAPLRHEYAVSVASFSPDGARIITACSNTAQVWIAATGAPVGEPLRHVGTVDNVSFSPDGARIVTDGARVNTVGTGTAQVWVAATGAPLGAPLQHEGDISSVSFSPDGARVVTASWDKTARVWNSVTGVPLNKPLQHDDVVRVARFSPDGTRVVTASVDKTARIWDAATGAQVGAPLRHEDRVFSASFSPDGTRIVTACWNMTARVWDVATSAPLGVPLHHSSPVTGASFSPDGARVVTACLDTAQIWEVPTTTDVSPDVLAWARAVAGLRFKENGELEIIPDNERRKGLEQPKLPPGPWAELEAWLRTSGSERMLSPKSKIAVRQMAEQERDFGIPNVGTWVSLQSALKYDPTLPLARMMLANVMEKVERDREEGKRDATVLARAAHWRRYDLDRLPDDPKLWARAAEILRQLPEAQVGVRPKPIKAAEAADQADQRAKSLAR